MRAILILVILLVTLMALPAFAYDWVTNPANGHRYILVECTSWTTSESQAIALGGHLATINDASENQWLSDWTASITPDIEKRAWIGFFRKYNTTYPNGGWIWISGESVAYTNWNTGEPSNTGGNELWSEFYIRPQTLETISGHWNDTSERNEGIRLAIVEVVPEPSSLLAICAGIATLATLKRRKKR